MKKGSKTGPSSRGRDRTKQRRFVIKVMRPIFQTAVITVDAVNEERAVRLAFGKMRITEYILLKADIEGGQGEAVNQPWLDEKSYVFLADVASDWLVDIEVLEEEGLKGYLRRGRRSNVIPFRRSLKKLDDDDPE